MEKSIGSFVKVVFCLVVIGLMVVSCRSNSGAISAPQRVESVQQEVTSAPQRVESVQQEVTSVSQGVESVQQEVASVSQGVESVQQEVVSASQEVVSTPQGALSALMEGNNRFVASKKVHPNSDMERVLQTAPHQEPFAAVIGCSDSRVPVEVIFDRGIGDIFVIRTAGNNVEGDMVMGSVEYAVSHLGVKVLLVLGHGSCGGVKGAISGGEHHGAIGNLLHHIRCDIPEFVGKPEMLDEAVRRHIDVQLESVMTNELVARCVGEGKLVVKGAYYDVGTGNVILR